MDLVSRIGRRGWLGREAEQLTKDQEASSQALETVLRNWKEVRKVARTEITAQIQPVAESVYQILVTDGSDSIADPVTLHGAHTLSQLRDEAARAIRKACYLDEDELDPGELRHIPASHSFSVAL